MFEPATMEDDGGGGEPGLLAEINVTPFVDVMLVLLVIFMVAAPLMVEGVPVELPRLAAGSVPRAVRPVVVSVGRDETVSLGGTRMGRDELARRLGALRGASGDVAVYIRADRGVPYGAVMDVLGWFRAAGFTRASLLTALPAEGGGP